MRMMREQVKWILTTKTSFTYHSAMSRGQAAKKAEKQKNGGRSRAGAASG